jgi:hypothetical protein
MGVYHHSDIIFQRHSMTTSLSYAELLPSAERTVNAEVELLVDW